MDYQVAGEGVWVRKDVAGKLRRVDGVVFDVDGVLMDVHGSFPHVIADAAQAYFEEILGWQGGRLLEAGETSLFKQAGGFNSDWALTRGAVLYFLAKSFRHESRDLAFLRQAEPGLAEFTTEVRRQGGGLAGVESAIAAMMNVGPADLARQLDAAELERLCCEHYGGADLCAAIYGFAPQVERGPGYINREEPLIRRESLQGRLKKRGIYTGRSRGEMPPMLRVTGLAGAFMPEAVVTSSDGVRKPHPRGLIRVAEVLDLHLGVFVGDNVDDLQTVLNYREQAPATGVPEQSGRRGSVSASGAPRQYLFAGILGGAPGERAEQIFREQGADLIATDVNRLLQVLQVG